MIEQVQAIFVGCGGGFCLILMSLGKIPAPGWMRTGFGAKVLPWLGLAMIATGLYLAYAARAPKLDAHALVEESRHRLTLPKMLDSETRLDDVTALSRSELRNIYTLTSLEAAQLDPATRMRLEQAMRTQACSQDRLKKLLETGYVIESVYRARDGSEAFRVRLVAADCDR